MGDKKLKLAEEEMEDDEEPTGMFTDMMAEFKQGLGAQGKATEQMGRYQEDKDTSLQVSMVAEPDRERTRLEASRMGNIASANMTGAHNFTNNMTGVHNLTPAPPSLDLTGVAPHLDMTAAPTLNVSSAPP